MKKSLEIWLKSNLFLTSLLLFIITFTLLSINITKPFYGEHDWNGVRYGNIARNYLKYGLFETKLGQVENSGWANSDQFQYFTHYPPTLPLLIALDYKIFGVAEWSARLTPIIATSLIVVMIFLIGAKIASFQVGLVAALLSLVTPLVLYFGKTPVHEPVVILFVLMAFFSYLNYQQQKKKIFLTGFIIFLTLAQLTTWAGFFLIPSMLAVALLRKDLTEAKRLLPFIFLSLGVFLFYLLFVAFLTGSLVGGDLLGVLLQRSGISPAGQTENLNLLTYMSKLRVWIFTLYTTTLSILAFFWLISRKFNIFSPTDWSIVTLGIFGLTYLILFSNSSFIHNYLVFYLLPFMSLAAAAAWVKLTSGKLIKKYSLILSFLVILLVAREKLNFLQALNSSQADKLAVEIGKTIKAQTKVEDVVLITPADFGYSADNFLKFYSDREIIYATSSAKLIPNVVVYIDKTNQKFYLARP